MGVHLNLPKRAMALLDVPISIPAPMVRVNSVGTRAAPHLVASHQTLGKPNRQSGCRCLIEPSPASTRFDLVSRPATTKGLFLKLWKTNETTLMPARSQDAYASSDVLTEMPRRLLCKGMDRK